MFKSILRTGVRTARFVPLSNSGLILLSARLCSTNIGDESATLAFQHNALWLTVPLPTRERSLPTPVKFQVCPFTQNLRDVASLITKETDGAISSVDFLTQNENVTSSTRLSKDVKASVLLQEPVTLQLLDGTSFTLTPPPNSASVDELMELKTTIAQLGGSGGGHPSDPNVKKLEAEARLEELKKQFEPLERIRQTMALKAHNRNKFFMNAGLCYMALQFGFLARLTWWEYSWDIMEPVTYFVTYGTAIMFYAYFCFSNHTEPDYSSIAERQKWIAFHKAAKKHPEFSYDSYNDLREKVLRAETSVKLLEEQCDQMKPRVLRTSSSSEDDSSSKEKLAS